MQKFTFKNLDQIIDFIQSTNDFDEWETMIFRLSANNGLSYNISTQINNSLGFRNFIEFRKLRTTLKQFYEANSFQTINFEIKLKFPDTLRKMIDKNNDFEALYLNLFCDAMNVYMDISFFESGIIIGNDALNSDPIQRWGLLVNNLYTRWKQLKNIQ